MRFCFLLIILVLLVTILYPLLRVYVASFNHAGSLSPENYRDFFDIQHPSNLEALWNSVWISLASVLLSGIVGVSLAFLFSRFDFPGRRVFASFATLPLVLPPLIGVIAFMFLYGETGIIPRGLKLLLRLESVPFGFSGILAVLLFHAYSMYVFFFLMARAGLGAMDRSLLEAAYNLGGSRANAFLRVTLPMLTPALVAASLLVFMTSMASFSAPFILASQLRVLSLQIYNSKLNNNMDMAFTQSTVLSLISIGFLLALRWYQGRRQYTMETKGVATQLSPIIHPVGKWALFAVALVVTTILVLPHLVIILCSFSRDSSWTYQVLPPVYTTENYLRLFRDARVWQPIGTSLKTAFLATGANVTIGFAAAYLVTKGTFRGRRLLDLLVMLPWALPGTVVAINLIMAFGKPTLLTFNRVLVGTFWILPLAYFIRHLPIVFRSSCAALEQLNESMREAAENLGASKFYTFRRVILPLVLPGVLSGALLAFVTALGEFVSSVLLWTPANRPISVEILGHSRQGSFGSAAAYSVFLILLITTVLLLSSRILRLDPQRQMVS